MRLTVTNRKSISDDLSIYDCLAKKGDFVEVTEWVNGEGYDISVRDKLISLTHGEIEAINYLIKCLDFSEKKKIVKEYEY